MDRDSLITAFCELTGASTQLATQYLSESQWDLSNACTAWYADEEDDQNPSTSAGQAAEPAYTGPRTLDGRPAPQYAGASSSSASKKPQKRTGLATLSSLGGSHSHDDDDDDEDDDDDDERRGPRDLFAGGEKSGLAVQDPAQRSSSSDPRKVISSIVAKAKANAKKSENEPDPAASSSRFFRGGGQTLGGDGVESRRVGTPAGPAPTATSEAPAVERILHIWHDGFSIDDGELRLFDDPQNQADLNMIRQGRAPLHLMNVRPDQHVEVKLEQHDEKYRPLPKIYRPFGGEGRRLGSPVPGVGSTQPPPAAPAPAASAATSSSASVDESQPTLNLRIQLPDGTRLVARFNTTHTVGDVYGFISRALPSTSTRPWVLSTTFPNKDHADKGLVLGDMAEFKRGGTAVVKWV